MELREEMDINLITKSTQIAELKIFLDTCQDGIDTMIGEFGARLEDRDKELVLQSLLKFKFSILDEARQLILN